MNNLNSIIIEGNVVRQNSIIEPVDGFKKYTFSVAVNRWYKNKDGEGVSEVSYFDIVTFGKMAEHTMPKATKGRGIRVVGRLKQDRWEDSTGKKFSKVYVVAEHIEYKPILDNSVETKESETSEEINYEVSEVPEPVMVTAEAEAVF